jgi:S1-C subfamily serine protease
VKLPKDPRDVVDDCAPAVAYVDVEDSEGEREIGTAFHVGGGIFVTAAHVVDDKRVLSIATTLPTRVRDANGYWRPVYSARCAESFEILRHPDPNVDVACFRTDLRAAVIPLSLHTDDVLSSTSFALEPVVVMGYPPVPMSAEPVLVCTRGEVNACFRPYQGAPRPHFIISPIARGGFSGGPALLLTGDCLGVITQSFNRNHQPAEQGFFAVLSIEAILEALRHHGVVPAEQEHITYLYELLDYATQVREERDGTRDAEDRPPRYIVSAWDGINKTCAFDILDDRERAISRATALAAEHASGEWTVFRVFQTGIREPIYRVTVPDAGYLVHPRREP